MRAFKRPFIFILIACLACDAERIPDAKSPGQDPIDRNASAEDLYFEFVRLHSLDLVSERRMEVLQATLDDIELRPDTVERSHDVREAIASMLRRTLGELKKTDPELADAMEAREYARRLNRQGIVISQDLSEVTLIIAGCLGVPTNKGELALVVLLPAGGYLVGKIANVALKRAVFLLRRARSLEDALIISERVSLELKVARDSPELASIIGRRPINEKLLARTTTAIEQQGAGGLGKLRAIGPGTLESSGGLVYGPGSAHGNRVLHVLEHAADIPGRAGAHGVFSGGRSGIIGTIDEAYGLARAGGPGVSIVQQGARTIYTVDMSRSIGFVGGQAGAALGNPAASHVRLVLEGTNVITAFPVIP